MADYYDTTIIPTRVRKHHTVNLILPCFLVDLYYVLRFKKRWTSLTDYVDFCSVLHGLQIAEYSSYRIFYSIFWILMIFILILTS